MAVVDFLFVFQNAMHQVAHYRKLTHWLHPIKVKSDPLKALVQIINLLLYLILVGHNWHNLSILKLLNFGQIWLYFTYSFNIFCLVFIMFFVDLFDAIHYAWLRSCHFGTHPLNVLNFFLKSVKSIHDVSFYSNGKFLRLVVHILWLFYDRCEIISYLLKVILNGFDLFPIIFQDLILLINSLLMYHLVTFYL